MPHASHSHASPPRAHGAGHVAMVIQRFRPAFTGQGVQVEQICGGLARAGVRSTILTAVRGRPTETEACDGYAVRRLRVDLLPGSRERIRFWAPTFGVRVLLSLARLRPDVVHVHGPTDGLIGAWLYGRLTGTPTAAEMTLLGDDDPEAMHDRRGPGARLRWSAYRGFDRWIAMSEAFLPSVRRAGLPPERVVVIPQAVDVERFRPVGADERAALRSALQLPPDAPVAAFVGAISHRKGVDVLLDAWESIVARRPDARLLVVGGAPGGTASAEDLALLERLRQMGASGVLAPGHMDAPEEALRAADVFLFPSRREGFGSVIVEAMACGLPCVVAELPGITDYVLEGREGAAGFVVAQQDAEALGARALELFESPARREQIGRRARRIAERRFALGTIVERYRQLYADLLAEPLS